MSDFANKTFNGKVYTFSHLDKTTLTVDLVVQGNPISIPVYVTFSHHCFTEGFDARKHGDHHRYTHNNGPRAFDLERYEYSLQMPEVMKSLLTGTIYPSDRAYAYVAQISLPPGLGKHAYSIFFSLTKTRRSDAPAVELYVKSAYPSALKKSAGEQSWRFKALVGEKAQVFPPAPPKQPSKKKNAK